jgi:hypothetical protein
MKKNISCFLQVKSFPVEEVFTKVRKLHIKMINFAIFWQTIHVQCMPVYHSRYTPELCIQITVYMPIFARSLRLCEINFAPLRGKNSIFASRGGGGLAYKTRLSLARPV